MDTRHVIVREKDKSYSLNCLVVNRTWPFDPPGYRVVMICPLCNYTRLDINPVKKNEWIITEDNE